MSPTTRTVLASAVALVVALAVFVVFGAPLCLSTGCTPAERQALIVESTVAFAPADACVLRELALGEALEPGVIVAQCLGATLESVGVLASWLLAGGLDASESVDAGADAGAPFTSMRALRRRRLHAIRVRALAGVGLQLLGDSSQRDGGGGAGEAGLAPATGASEASASR